MSNGHPPDKDKVKRDLLGPKFTGMQPLAEKLVGMAGLGAEALVERLLGDADAMLTLAFNYLDKGNDEMAERLLELSLVHAPEKTLVHNVETPSLSDTYATRLRDLDERAILKGSYFIKRVGDPRQPTAEYACAQQRQRRQDRITTAKGIVERVGARVPLVNGDTLSDRVRDTDMTYREARFYSRQADMPIAGVKIPTEHFFVYENIVGPNVNLLFRDLNKRMQTAGSVIAKRLKEAITNADVDNLAFFYANQPEIPSHLVEECRHREKLERTVMENMSRYGIRLPREEMQAVNRAIDSIGHRLEAAGTVFFRDATPDNNKISYVRLLESLGDLPPEMAGELERMRIGENPDLDIETVCRVNNYLFRLVDEDKLSERDLIGLYLANFYPIDFANSFRKTTNSDDMTHLIDRRLSGYSIDRQKLDHRFLLKTLSAELEREGIYEAIPAVAKLTGLVDLDARWGDISMLSEDALRGVPPEYIGTFRARCDSYFSEMNTTAFFRNLRFWNLFSGWFVRGEDFDVDSFDDEGHVEHLLDIDHHFRRSYAGLYKEVQGSEPTPSMMRDLARRSEVDKVVRGEKSPREYIDRCYQHPGNIRNFTIMLGLLRDYDER